MRKDKIEERISQLEKEVRTLKTDHKYGVDTILTEMRTFQNFIIEERIATIHQQLEERYKKLFTNLLLKNATNVMDEEFHDPCVRNRRKECNELFLSRLRSIANASDYSDQALNHDSEYGNEEEFVAQHPTVTEFPCKDCYNIYLNQKKQLQKTVTNLADYKKSLLGKNDNTFISELPDDAVISSIVEPLSHENRFAMLKALSTGSMTFKELSQLTNSKGGHLIYHLNKIIDSGLVIKDDASKRYSITDKGMGVMDLIKKLYNK